MKDFMLYRFLPVAFSVVFGLFCVFIFFYGIGELIMHERYTIHSLHKNNKNTWEVEYSIDGRFSKGHIYDEEFGNKYDAELFAKSLESK